MAIANTTKSLRGIILIIDITDWALEDTLS